jgi:hypothetical protein
MRNTYNVYHISFPGLTLDVYVQALTLNQHRRNYTDEQIYKLMGEYADAPAPLPEQDVRKEIYKVHADGYTFLLCLYFLVPVCSLFLCIVIDIDIYIVFVFYKYANSLFCV